MPSVEQVVEPRGKHSDSVHRQVCLVGRRTEGARAFRIASRSGLAEITIFTYWPRDFEPRTRLRQRYSNSSEQT